MYSTKLIKKVFVLMLVFLMSVYPLLAQATYNLSFAKGRIILKEGGMFIEGKNLSMTSDMAYMEVGGYIQEFALADVQQIMAKRGLGKKYGLASGGCCLGLSLASVLSVGDETTTDADGNEVEYDTGQLILGSLIWTAIFYGVGYLVGAASDNWQIVYMDN